MTHCMPRVATVPKTLRRSLMMSSQWTRQARYKNNRSQRMPLEKPNLASMCPTRLVLCRVDVHKAPQSFPVSA